MFMGEAASRQAQKPSSQLPTTPSKTLILLAPHTHTQRHTTHAPHTHVTHAHTQQNRPTPLHNTHTRRTQSPRWTHTTHAQDTRGEPIANPFAPAPHLHPYLPLFPF